MKINNQGSFWAVELFADQIGERPFASLSTQSQLGAFWNICLWLSLTSIDWRLPRAFSSRERNDVLLACFLFVGFKRWEDYLRVPRIRPMHGLAVVAKSFLGEALRVTSDFGALRPRVAIRMQSDSFNSGFPASPLEMGQAMPLT
jgi:hypothetical protein